MNTLELVGHKIYLNVGDARWWPYAAALTGKVKEVGPGRFEYSLSAQNLERIHSVFTGDNKPVITKGEHILQTMRSKFVEYQQRKRRIKDVKVLDRYPVEPNGMFIPYGHQTKIIGCVEADPYLPVFSDCGTGKTGSMIRAIELALQNKEVTKGKILVTAPLSILETSWADDVKKFSKLNCKALWTAISNRTLKVGDKEVVHDYGPPPEGMLTKKSKKETWYFRHKMMVKILDEFQKAEGGWEKKQVTFTEAIMPDGSKVAYGPVVAQGIAKESTRENFIRDCLKDPDVDLFLINHDGVRIYEDILKEHAFEWVIVDESTKIKSAQSQVFKSHVEISWGSKRRNILTGTPNPNGFQDLWSQYYFLDRGLTLCTTLKDFQFQYFREVHVGHFNGKDASKWVMKDDDAVKSLVAKVHESAIFLRQRDCVDLPPRTDLKRRVFMTKEQTDFYLKMEKDLVAEILNTKTQQSEYIEAKNVLSKMMKLRQITSGYATNPDGEIVRLPVNPKLDELDDFIEEIGDSKLVIACQFKEEIRTLLDRYKGLGIAAIYGDEKKDDRSKYIRSFQDEDTIKIMVLQPAAAAHGITLTRAPYLLFLSLDYNFEYYYQTAKRIERIGQKNAMFVNHFLARTADNQPTIDEDLLDIMGSKNKDRDALFTETQDTVEIASLLKGKLVERVNNR